MKAAYKGIKYTNETAPYLAEYNKRLRLAKLGYRFDGGNLSAEKAEIFCEISAEIEKLQADDMRSSNGKQRKNRP